MKGKNMKLKSLTLITLLTILLSACGSIGGDPLDGTSWELYAYRKSRPIEGSHITITFEDGQVRGSSGCNSYGGEYIVSGKEIEIGMLMSTLMACVDPAMMEQESMFMQFLGNAQRFEIVDGQLQVFWSEHEALTFVPARARTNDFD
jgi:heat shock protein HslJ